MNGHRRNLVIRVIISKQQRKPRANDRIMGVWVWTHKFMTCTPECRLHTPYHTKIPNWGAINNDFFARLPMFLCYFGVAT